jgi:hypothetical protein
VHAGPSPATAAPHWQAIVIGRDVRSSSRQTCGEEGTSSSAVPHVVLIAYLRLGAMHVPRSVPGLPAPTTKWSNPLITVKNNRLDMSKELAYGRRNMQPLGPGRLSVCGAPNGRRASTDWPYRGDRRAAVGHTSGATAPIDWPAAVWLSGWRDACGALRVVAVRILPRRKAS